MIRVPRVSTAGVLILCLAATPWSGVLAASEEHQPSGLQNVARASSSLSQTRTNDGPILRSALRLAAEDSAAMAQRRGGRGRRGSDRNGGAQAALVLGAAATIAGTALLLYANRPDCNGRPDADGCGYGTKVAGGSLLSAGIIGVVVGAVTWR